MAIALRSKDLYPEIFSRHASAYEHRLEQVMTRGEARGRQRVIEFIEARPGMRVLDLACGPGNLSRRLALKVAPDGEVVGVDLAPGMIERARLGATANARFELMDIEQLSFPDASFDAAVCGHGLQFVPALDRALSEARRVLRPGARFAASVPSRQPSRSVTTLLGEVVDRWLPPAPKAIDQDTTRNTIADPEALRQAAVDAGFGSAAVESVEEDVEWESADLVVEQFASWWDCAARLDLVDPARRKAFLDDARSTLRREHPGAIVTTGGNLVLIATA